MRSNTTITELNKLFQESTIDLLKYNLKSNMWWGEQKAILLKTYVNFSGDIIEKGSEVRLLFKMQEQRFDYFIHHGMFFVQDYNMVKIGGVHCKDLLIQN